MVTGETRLCEIYDAAVIRDAREYLIGNGTRLILENIDDTLRGFQQKNPTWYANDLAYGLNRLLTVAEEEPGYFFPVYEEETIAREPEKKDVKLFWFPAKGDVKRANIPEGAFAVLLAGGAYQCVCSMVEAMPVAAKLNDMGISAFCLNYRVGQKGLMPKPLEDLAAAFRFLAVHAEQFHICSEHFAVGGFSAGGHVASCWGVEDLGFRHYGLPAPELLLLDYPAISTENRAENLPPAVWEIFLNTLVGDERTEEACRKYSVNCQVDGNYPPVYLVQAQDDSTISSLDSLSMLEALEREGIPYRAERPMTGGHGFGLGSATPAAGWVERAVCFWKELIEEEKRMSTAKSGRRDRS